MLEEKTYLRHAKISICRPGSIGQRGRTPVRPRIRTNISEANLRMVLQQLDEGQEARALDAAYGQKQGPDARRRNRRERVDCHRHIWEWRDKAAGRQFYRRDSAVVTGQCMMYQS
jgi:hypothetical protein